MALLLEIVLPLVLLAIVATVVYKEWQARHRRAALWEPRTLGLPEGGFAVVLECDGQPSQVVARIPPGLAADEFSERLAEAESEAQADAAALNASTAQRARIRR